MNKNPIELEEGWYNIETKGVMRIINFLENQDNTGFGKKDYSELYTVVYNMCTQPRNKNYSTNLYERFGQTLANYIEKYIKPDLESQSTGLPFLSCLSRSWNKYKMMTKWLKNFFQYLDRHHVNQNNLPSLSTVSDEKFLTMIVNNFKDNHILKWFLEILKNDREGESSSHQGSVSNRDVLKDVYQMILVLDAQAKVDKLCPVIEKNILDDTYKFYAEKSSIWISEDSLSDYLNKAEENLLQENIRCAYIMGESSSKKIEAKFLEIVIKDKISPLLNKETGIKYLLVNEKKNDLGRLHRLTVGISDCQSPIATALTKHIKAEGDLVINDKLQKNESLKVETPEDPEFVKSLMKLQNRFKSLLAESFKNDSTYQRALNSGFEEIVNKRIGKYTFAEILACYADKMLKKTNNRMSEEEIEENLLKIIELFERLEDKYLFAEIYKNQLAKRLLNDLSANEDAEKSIISKMKMCCGSQYTAKMEGMLTDLHLAEEIQLKYKNKNYSLPIEFTVQVLTNSHWPYFNNYSLELPEKMQACINNFKNFYSEITQNRKLYWMNNLGTIEVTREYDSGRYNFVCSPYQGITLCLFNNRPELSFRDIKVSMGFEDDICKKILNLFISPKYKILEKNGGERKVNEDDVFRLNLAFNNPGKKLRLPIPLQEENYAKEKVAEDRNHAIDASIVRIMKARKNLSHNSLINEVISVLSVFRPQIRDIKLRIENLISREFLERDKNDNTKYNYLA